METGEEEDAYSSPHRIKSTVLGLITNGGAFGLIVLTKRLLLWSLLTFILWLPLIFDDSDSIISHLFYYLFAFVASVAYLVLYLFGNNISAMVLGILISAILAVRSQIQTHGLVHTLINPFIQLFEKVYRSVCAILPVVC